MKKYFLVLCLFFFHSAIADVDFVQLGNTINHGCVWREMANGYWYEIGSGINDGCPGYISINGDYGNYVGADGVYHDVTPNDFRVSITPSSTAPVKLAAMIHIRSGDGTCRGRLYNKLRIVRTYPTRNENLMIDSEALVELSSGCYRFFDATRTILARDTSPVVGVLNVYSVEAVAGDGVWTEVSFGSTLEIR